MRIVLLCSIFSFFLTACTPVKSPPTTADAVDLKRYVGTWYEIASFPNRFQRGCRCTQAQYAFRPDGAIEVINQCRRGPKDEYSIAKGKAWLSDPTDPSQSKLKVQFFWPFRGNYWILALDSNYQTVLVGNPRRNYLWILARERQIPLSTFMRFKEIAKSKGYDVSKLVKTNQVDCDNAHPSDRA